MLTLEIHGMELFDEATDKFINIKPQQLKLEHSLISISKWESKWEKSFLNKERKTREEVIDYIRCMIISPARDIDIIQYLSDAEINKVIDYIDSPMTATTVTFFENKKKNRKEETITSELIYYWMISANIPFECEKWHINRLFSLLKICSAKSAPKQKSNTPEAAKLQADINAARRARLKSRG